MSEVTNKEQPKGSIWGNPYPETIVDKATGMVISNILHSAAEAAHAVDIQWMRKHIISKSLDRWIVLSIHIDAWEKFTKGGKPQC